MTDFVHEQVNQLNTALSSVFQNQQVSQQISTTTTTVTDPVQALDQNDLDLFLTCASRDIDLASTTTLPDIDLVKKYLELYSKYSDSNRSKSNNENSLEWLFVAKCTVAVYGFMLKNILNSTLPLSEAIQYWHNIYGSRRYETYYALQTLPVRISNLGINTVKKMCTTQLGLTNLLGSREHLFCNLFPAMYSNNGINMAKPQRKGAEKTFRFFHSMKNGSVFKQLIHEEIRHKIHTLDHFKIQQASRLGLLMKMSPFTMKKEENGLDSVSTQSHQCISLMKQILDPLVNSTIQDKFDVNEAIQALSEQQQPQAPTEIAKGLSTVIDDWNSKCQVNITSLKTIYGPPSFLTRYWIPGIIGYFAGNAFIQLITERQDDLIRWFHELGVTTQDFLVHWIWEPVLQVWDTIRLKDDEQRFGVLGKEGLRSDLESLERMVSEFARDHYKLPEPEVTHLIQNVRQGDMSLILKAYENEIKHPIKNVVQGDLIQTLLIQVQKTKVDVDLAMAALDKLLKSNELNFAFLAVAPSMLIAWGAISWINRIWQRRSGRNIGKIGLPIRQSMRRIERLFNLTYSEQNNIGNITIDYTTKYPEQQQQFQLDCETQGILLCEVHLLRSYARHLPSRNSMRDLFIEDLRDLENPRLSTSQKLQTIHRMSRSWSFLRPSSSFL